MNAKYDESEKLIKDVPPHLSMVPFYDVFGGIHARHGEWLEALTNWNWVLEYAPEDHVGYMYLAPLLLQLDDVNGYKSLRAQILQHFGSTSDPRIAERMVKASLILPPTAEELATIAKMAEVAGRGEVNNENWGFNLFAMGFAQYRLGHYTSAVELMQKLIPLDMGSHCRTEAYLINAMAQFQLGQPTLSHDSFSNPVAIVINRLPKAGHLDDEWNDWIIIHILMREAVALNPEVEKLLPTAPEKEAWQEALTKSGFKFSTEQQGDGTWEVDIDDQPVTDISMLQGAPLSRLTLMHTSVSDLTLARHAAQMVAPRGNEGHRLEPVARHAAGIAADFWHAGHRPLTASRHAIEIVKHDQMRRHYQFGINQKHNHLSNHHPSTERERFRFPPH